LVTNHNNYDYSRQVALNGLERSLRAESRLVLAEYDYRALFNIENSQRVFGVAVPVNRMLFAVHYRLRAGISLEDNFELIYNDFESVTVKLGSPQIFSVTALDETIYSFDNWSLPLTTIRLADFLPAIEAETAEVTARALNDGILQRVQNNATLFFTTHLAALGFSYIDVVIN